VLANQHRRRRHQSDLLASERHCARCSQRDFGLAESHIPAHQPVHGWRSPGEIGENCRDRPRLVLGLDEREAGDEAAIRCAGRLQGRSGGLGSPRGARQQLACRDLELPFDLGPARLPVRAAQAVERDIRRAGAVAPDAIALEHRHQQLAAAGIFQRKELGSDALMGWLEELQAAQPSDPVLPVHDGIARTQLTGGERINDRHICPPRNGSYANVPRRD
jgi:hypothetical protein